MIHASHKNTKHTKDHTTEQSKKHVEEQKKMTKPTKTEDSIEWLALSSNTFPPKLISFTSVVEETCWFNCVPCPFTKKSPDTCKSPRINTSALPSSSSMRKTLFSSFIPS